MRNVIDFHTHAFPDKIAQYAITDLEAQGTFKAVLNGTLADLLKSMDNAGVSQSVVALIATKPEQFGSIIRWSKEISSDRIIPFPSIHPDDEMALDHIQQIADEGFKGIKLHPYYQSFSLNDPKMFKIYEKIQSLNLILLCHTGFDCAFPTDRICDPEKIIDVVNKFPDLKFITSHLGAWEDWDEVEKYLLGKPIYMEISFAHGYLEPEKIKQFCLNHPKEYLLFGTDSPWASQKDSIDFFEKLFDDNELKDHIFIKNAQNLLRN